jgi:hypothetical protein
MSICTCEWSKRVEDEGNEQRRLAGEQKRAGVLENDWPATDDWMRRPVGVIREAKGSPLLPLSVLKN